VLEKNVEFISGTQKVKLLRKQLKMTQQEFQDTHFTRGYLGLLENGKRNITLQVSKIIGKKCMEKAKQQGIELELEDDYFSRTIEEDAKKYCEKELENDLSLEELAIVMDIAKSYSLNTIESKVFMKKGDIYFNKNQYLEAFKNFFYSMDIIRGDCLNSDICYVYNRLGYCKFLLLDYEEAIVYYNNAIYNAKVFGEENISLCASYNLALCYSYTSKFDEAIEIINNFITVVNNEEHFFYYIKANILQANCYEGMEEIDKAILILNNLIELVKEHQDEESNKLLGLIYNNLGILYTKKDELSRALEYFNLSQQIRMKVDKKKVARTLIEKANIYIKKNLHEEAIMIIELGIERAKECNDYKYIFMGYELLEEIYYKNHMIEKLDELMESAIGILENTDNNDLKIKYYVKSVDLFLQKNEYDKAKNNLNKIQNLL